MTAGPGRDDDRDNPGAPRVGYNQSDNKDGTRHHVLYDTEHPGHDDHISWDTDKDDDYIKGGRDRDGRREENWPDRGR